jgi:hypothetical protein
MRYLPCSRPSPKRLISHYGGVIPIVDRAGKERSITATTYETVRAAFFEWMEAIAKATGTSGRWLTQGKGCRFGAL